MTITARKSFYADFAAALLDPNVASVPADLNDKAATRFAVYRNNVHRGLGDGLIAAYPVVHRLVGEDFFRAMAREFFITEQKRNASMALYGNGFANFIELFPPAKSLPYLADVARLERAHLEALHAADAEPILPTILGDAPERLPSLHFVPHPATRIVVSAHPIVALWRANNAASADEEAVEIVLSPETALLTRPTFNVAVQKLTPAAGLFASLLFDGTVMVDAYTQAFEMDSEFDITETFGVLLSAGAFLKFYEGK